MNPIKEQLSQLVQDVQDGNESACKAQVILKGLETQIKSGLKLIKSAAVDEAREFDEGGRYFGGTWQIRSSATILFYDEDQEYNDFAKLASERKKLLNAAWKHNNEGHGFFITPEGEEIPVLKVKSPGTESAIFKETQPEAGEDENDGKTGLAF